MQLNPSDLSKAIDAYQAQSYATAKPLFEKLADRGEAEAQVYLGTMFQLGFGTAVSYERAIYWYLKASSQGHGLASNNLGTIYVETGDRVRARQYYSLAREQGFEHSPQLQEES